MQYPLISEYVEAIRSAEDNFSKLAHLRPVLDGSGNPVMSSGNFAVVFKMTDGTKNYAVKCFTREQEGRDESYRMIADELEFVSSSYLCAIRYYGQELFVDSSTTADTEFPVLLMDWVDGVTLDQYVRRHIADTYALQHIAYQFCRLASWLFTQSFAHGDLKPDNILVRTDGSLILVDYDGMFGLYAGAEGSRARQPRLPPSAAHRCRFRRAYRRLLAVARISGKSLCRRAVPIQRHRKQPETTISILNKLLNHKRPTGKSTVP